MSIADGMNLSAILSPASGALSGRFVLISYLPTVSSAVFLLVLVWAGAPGEQLDFGQAWQTATALSIGELVLLWIAVTLVAVVGYPFQLSLVRVLEGHWPPLLKPLTALSVKLQDRKRDRLIRSMIHHGTYPTPSEANRIGVAESKSRMLFLPVEFRSLPTALGNVLAAMAYHAGSAYGMDVVVVWPRVYPLLAADTKAIVDDRRDAMDSGCRLAATAMVSATASTWLLWSAGGWWLLIVPALLGVSYTAYRGAVTAAVSYSIAVSAAIDTHRFNLYDKLCLPLPTSLASEREVNERLSQHWRQGGPYPDLTYRRSEP
ncbi:hypothetical protein ACFXK0_22785 [Nocardia sp. NPDC059177]|uniref:hypothetical protein n=1 Tax=Nocardia sp. NPDC059177 TaxID=3346759 RepID=UPI0036CB0B72